VLANKRPSSRRGGPFLHVAFACRSGSAAGVPPLPNPWPPPLGRLVIRITAPIANEPPQLLPGSRRARAPTRAGGDRSIGEAATRDRVSRCFIFRFVRNQPAASLRGVMGGLPVVSACCRLVVVAHQARPPMNAAGRGTAGSRGGA